MQLDNQPTYSIGLTYLFELITFFNLLLDQINQPAQSESLSYSIELISWNWTILLGFFIVIDWLTYIICISDLVGLTYHPPHFDHPTLYSNESNKSNYFNRLVWLAHLFFFYSSNLFDSCQYKITWLGNQIYS